MNDKSYIALSSDTKLTAGFVGEIHTRIHQDREHLTINIAIFIGSSYQGEIALPSDVIKRLAPTLI